MVKKILLCFIGLLSLSCFAQNIVLKGNVSDVNSVPISYSNITLLNSDNGVIGGTTSNEEGVFQFVNLSAGRYSLRISFLGYKSVEKAIDLSKDLQLETIVLLENTEALDGVTIVAKRPTVKRLVDRLVFNVESSTLSNNNVLDVLKHTPGVLVHDGAIIVKNSTPTVYINDRRVHLSSDEVQQLLEGTSATNIKSIEVITNPPSKYEAEGGAVLNIVTSKNIIAGYNGSVNGNYKQGSEFPKHSFGTSHFFKTKKLNTYLNYSISPRKDFRLLREAINFIDDNGDQDINNDMISTSWESETEKRSKSSNQNINMNVNYELNDRNTIDFSTNMLIMPRDNSKATTSSLTNVYNSSGILDSLFKTTNRLVDEKFNMAFSVNYMHKFKNEGEKLSINVHHTNFDFSNFQNVDTGYFLSNEVNSFRDNRFQTFSSQVIKLYTSQIDYELPIKKEGKFEAGAKISNINSENILTQYIFEGAQQIEDIDNSDIFLYDETNYAIYSSYSKNWDNWQLKTGIRVESTNIKGNSLSTNQINNNSYIKLFPSLNLTHRLNDKNELYFKYNKRIYRPRYSQLNPFKYFLSDNAFIVGDPNLKPQIDDQFILGYTFNLDYTFEVYYRHEKKPTIQFINQDNVNNLLIYANTNTDTSFSYGLDFTTYKQLVSGWNLYVLSSIYYYKNNFFVPNNSAMLFSGDQWSFYTEISNYFSLLKDKSLTLDISYLHMSPTNDGPTNTSTISGLDINLRKNLWNNKASVSIGYLDAFNTKNFNTTTQYLNQDIHTKYRFENRLISFSFNYKFGNFKLKTNKKQIDLEERNRLLEN